MKQDDSFVDPDENLDNFYNDMDGVDWLIFIDQTSSLDGEYNESLIPNSDEFTPENILYQIRRRQEEIVKWLSKSKYSELNPWKRGFRIPKGIITRRKGAEIELLDWLKDEQFGRLDEEGVGGYLIELFDEGSKDEYLQFKKIYRRRNRKPK